MATKPVKIEREAIHAYVDVWSHRAWQSFAEENGVSVTGLIEALGREIGDEVERVGDPTEVRQPWVKAARKIDADRRRR